MEALKKMTVGGINNKRGGFIVKADDPDKIVGRIFGRADSAETKDSNFGPYIRFKGQFRSLNAEREAATSPVLILPAPADSLLAEAIKSDTTGLGVTFAFDIVLRAMPKKTEFDRGYEYVVKPLMESNAASDPMKALEASLPALPPLALAAPAGEATVPAAEPAAEAPAPAAAAKGKKA